MRLMLKNVRLAFPSLWKATAPASGGEPAFSASFILPKDHPQVKEINAALRAVATDKWNEKGAAVLKALQAADKTCLHSGDSKPDYDGFEGNLYVSARSKVRPSTFDGLRNEVAEADGVIYAGCYVNASLELWAMDNSYGKRINAQLRGVQFLRKGDAFTAGGAADSDEFDELGVEDTADDLTA